MLYAGYLQASKGIRELLRRRQTRGTHKDYYFRHQITGLRIVVPDKEYLHVREAEVIALREGLDAVFWGNRITGDVTVAEEWLDPRSLHFALAEQSFGMFESWNRRKVCFEHPLGRRQSRVISHVQRLVVTGNTPMRPYLGWSSDARVDCVQMRVSFGSDPPAQAQYSEHTSDGTIIYSEALLLDRITASFTKRIDNPLPGRYYYIRW